MGRDLSLEGEDNGDDDQAEDYNKSATKPYQVFFLFHANNTTDTFQIRTIRQPSRSRGGINLVSGGNDSGVLGPENS